MTMKKENQSTPTKTTKNENDVLLVLDYKFKINTCESSLPLQSPPKKDLITNRERL